MIAKPKFKDCFHVEVMEPDKVFLLTERQYQVLTGPIYKELAPFLTGEYSVTDIVKNLNNVASYHQLLYALNKMEAAGYIIEANDRELPATAAFWQLLGVNNQTAAERLSQTAVSVTALGQASAEPLLSALQEQNVQIGDNADLAIVVTDDYLQVGLEEINLQALATGTPWLLAKLIGTTIWLGPLFHPGQTACWACLAQRIRTNRQLESYILRKKGQSAPLPTSLAALPSTVQTGANMAALEIVKWILCGVNKQLKNQLMAFNTATAQLRFHSVIQRPQCPVCGRPDEYNRPRPIELQRYPKTIGSNNGSRALSLEETFARYEHLISPITGVITWLVDITEEVNGLWYNYNAGHSFALIQDNLNWLLQNLRSRTGGKGMSRIQAQVSAMGEAIERYSGVYQDDNFTVRGSYQSLAPKAIHLGQCLNFSQSQYDNRHTWNAQITGTRLHVVPNPFDETQEMEWTPVWSMTHKEFKYLPAAYCYFGHPETASLFYCSADSNGCAAGNTREEAILRGFLELVERDSVALWWYNRASRPLVDLDSFEIPYIYALKQYYEEHHREFWVLDITTDLGIPAFVAVSRRLDKEPEDILIGCAAHLEPEVALLQAITEMNQFLPAVSHVEPDGSVRYNFPDSEAIDWWQRAKLSEQTYLSPNRIVKTLADYPSLEGSSLQEDIQTCIEIAEDAGLEVLVLDQTRPDIGLPVCRVTVPGLRHFWRRLGSGRLYDIPMQLGWLDNVRIEEDMNPFSIFF